MFQFAHHPLRIPALTAALAFAIGGDGGHGAPAGSACAVERLALSSVSASVPGRGAVRKAQAAAILEARRLGLDLSIAAVGSGGAGVDEADDRRAFGRLVARFPATLQASLERNVLRERLAKARGGAAPGEGDAYNASAEVISDPLGRANACVVELRAPGEDLRAMLAMTFHDAAIDAIEHRARKLGVTAGDVAFLAAAHESSHCVLGTARRAGVLDTRWADPAWRVPEAWTAQRNDDDHDAPALAKAEESAADLLAIMLAADALGVRKARNLANLSGYAVSLGAQAPSNDALHDSSRALARLLANNPIDRPRFVADPTRLAWNLAAADTRAEVLADEAADIAANLVP